MRELLISIVIILVTIILVLITSLILEITFIKSLAIRQAMIYLLIALELFVGFRVFYLYNYKKE